MKIVVNSNKYMLSNCTPLVNGNKNRDKRLTKRKNQYIMNVVTNNSNLV